MDLLRPRLRHDNDQRHIKRVGGDGVEGGTTPHNELISLALLEFRVRLSLSLSVSPTS